MPSEGDGTIDYLWHRIMVFEPMWVELELTDSQQNELVEYVARKRQLVRMVSTNPKRFDVLASGENDFPQDIKDMLLPHQWRRIAQLELQARVIRQISSLGLLDRRVSELIGLDGSQRLSIGKTAEEFDRKEENNLTEHREEFTRHLHKVIADLTDVLTMEQRIAYTSLVGEPWKEEYDER